MISAFLASFMNTYSLRSIRKRHVALALGLIALISIAYSVSTDYAIMHEDSNVAGILTAVAQSNASGYQMFLKLDTIPGESKDSKHREEVEIDSFAWGTARSLGATKASFDSLKFTMPVNKASPKLFLYTAGGVKITRAVLSVRKPGSSDDFLKWILTDAQPISFQTVGNTHGDGVSDQVVLTAGKVEVEYKPTDGSAVQKAGWDARSGKSVSY